MPLALTPEHLAMLRDGSGIRDEVIAERGYQSLTGTDGTATLQQLGFSGVQAKLLPGLLLPLHTTDGQQPLAIYRPDHPRWDGTRNRSRKYENPAKAGVRLDCPPRCHARLADPAIPLWITEGQRKADSLASRDACAIALLGVWNFKGKNPFGGTTVLADFDYVTWKGRDVRLVFDSDSHTNPDVRHALDRLTEHLQRKGARVRIAPLPQSGEQKVGVDDFFVAGHTVQDLEALLTPAKPGASSEGETLTQFLLRLAKPAFCFKTPEGACYARVPVNHHHQVLEIAERGGGFRRWLLDQFREKTGDTPNTTAVAQVVEAMLAKTEFGTAIAPVYTRIAWYKDALYLDLANEAWEVVKITSGRWTITTDAPISFRRPPGMLPLPRPDRTGTMADFYTLLPGVPDNADGKAVRMLCTAWALGVFQPEGAKAHLCLHGVQGSAKSTTTKMLRMLIDPNKAPSRSTPKEERDLVLAATNGCVVALENLSHIPLWLSDALCCLSTGAGIGTRKLYTNDEESIFAAQCPAILNGITEVAVRGDLVDRCVFVTLPAIAEDARQLETALWGAFHTAQAKALGALLTAVSTALKHRKSTHLEKLPRMADFAQWVEAAAPALGWKPGEFLAVYQANRQSAVHISLDASLIAPPLLQYLGAVGEFPEKDTPDADKVQDLLTALTQWKQQNDAKLPKEWPKSPQSLSAHLHRLTTAFQAIGWRIAFGERTMTGKPISITPLRPPPPRGQRFCGACRQQQPVHQEQDAGGVIWCCDQCGAVCGFEAPNGAGQQGAAPPRADDPMTNSPPTGKSSSCTSSWDNSLQHNGSDEPDELDELFAIPLYAREEKKNKKEERKNRGVGKTSSSSSCSSEALKQKELHNDEVHDELFSAPQSSSCTSSNGAASPHVTVAPTLALPPVDYVTTPAQLETLLPTLRQGAYLGLDCETTGLDPLADRIRLLQLATPERVVLVDAAQVPLTLVAELLMNPHTHLLGHNLKFDVEFLIKAGLPWPAGKLFDTMLAARLLGASTETPPRGHYSLEQVVQRELTLTLDKTLQTSEWSGTLSTEQLTYAATDAAVLLPLAETLQTQLKAAELTRITAIERGCLLAMVWVELAGIPIDRAAWEAVAAHMQGAADRAYAELETLGGGKGRTMNWRSGPQIKQLLQARGYDIPNTQAETLAPLAAKDPLIAALVTFRKLQPLVSTFGVQWLAEHLHPTTNRVHANYMQIGSRAGRMSCSHPNMQNVPRGQHRACIRVPEGSCLIKADYSQIELRLAAIIAPDPTMLQALQSGQDLHTLTASRLLGVEPAQVTQAARTLAKAVNFGLLYGMGASRFQQKAYADYHITLTLAEAQQHRQRFFQLYPGLKRWHTQCGARAERQADTRTLWGRRRAGIADFKEHANTPVQGSAGDGFKLALARLFTHRHDAPAARVVGLIHDEILVECPVEQAEQTAAWLEQHMREAMEDVVQHQVPIVVETTIAQDWAGTPVVGLLVRKEDK